MLGKSTIQTDVIIVGGGMVGAATAIGLAQQNYKVVLIEKQALQPFSASQPPDMRLSAFNMHSANLLSTLGAWKHVQKMRYKQYNELSVWEGNSAKTTFSAKDIGAEQLGYFVENRLIQLALFDEIQAKYTQNIQCIHEQDITHIDVAKAQIELDQGLSISGCLIIGADGAQSQVRKAAGIATSGWQYAQHANAILIETTQALPASTWQEFHPSGPRALLPMHDNYACLVWYDSHAQTQWIKQASSTQLKQALRVNFPDCLPEFKILQVANFALTRMHAHDYGRQKALILGDAAHTINPLAGQGINLGFKDVAALLAIIDENGLEDASILIKAFEQKRKLSNLLMMSTMDVLYTTFSTPLLPIKAARMFGLRLANRAGPLKNKALKYAMGL